MIGEGAGLRGDGGAAGTEGEVVFPVAEGEPVLGLPEPLLPLAACGCEEDDSWAAGDEDAATDGTVDDTLPAEAVVPGSVI